MFELLGVCLGRQVVESRGRGGPKFSNTKATRTRKTRARGMISNSVRLGLGLEEYGFAMFSNPGGGVELGGRHRCDGGGHSDEMAFDQVVPGDPAGLNKRKVPGGAVLLAVSALCLKLCWRLLVNDSGHITVGGRSAGRLSCPGTAC